MARPRMTIRPTAAAVVGGGETGAFSLGRYLKFASVMNAMGVQQSTIGMKNGDLSADRKAKYDLEGTLPMPKV